MELYIHTLKIKKKEIHKKQTTYFSFLQPSLGFLKDIINKIRHYKYDRIPFTLNSAEQDSFPTSLAARQE